MIVKMARQKYMIAALLMADELAVLGPLSSSETLCVSFTAVEITFTKATTRPPNGCKHSEYLGWWAAILNLRFPTTRPGCTGEAIGPLGCTIPLEEMHWPLGIKR